ncbi:TetR/AcrR family transcriptional regulator [Comamonas composti]|uniref:TetR/AcrR family transcriptional regulator n=1 Tax=Comamonas composti TaxID=408558 RepID=UPI00042908DF|nr:TetR/AcrR family transcriptional regulator [Comamonas composti]
MTASSPAQEVSILPALALALTNHPRASLQELAKAIGISKATLYRFSRTREDLVARLLAHSMQTMSAALAQARLQEDHPLQALQRLTALNLEQREFVGFLTYYWKEVDAAVDESAHWDEQLDAFFLRGQQQGVFRIDFSAAALAEIWISTLLGLADAERRGRVARAELASLVERAFLQGSQAQRPDLPHLPPN